MNNKGCKKQHVSNVQQEQFHGFSKTDQNILVAQKIYQVMHNKNEKCIYFHKFTYAYKQLYNWVVMHM